MTARAFRRSQSPAFAVGGVGEARLPSGAADYSGLQVAMLAWEERTGLRFVIRRSRVIETTGERMEWTCAAQGLGIECETLGDLIREVEAWIERRRQNLHARRGPHDGNFCAICSERQR